MRKQPFEADFGADRFLYGDLKSDEHRVCHPLGSVPVLDDGYPAVCIRRNRGISGVRHSDGVLQPATDSLPFPQYLQWLHHCESMLMPSVNAIVVQTILLLPDRRNEVTLKQAQKLLTKALVPVDKALTERDYIIIDNFSVA